MARTIPLPPPNVVICNPQDGLVHQDWYDWFRQVARELQAEEGEDVAVTEGSWTPSVTFSTPGDVSATYVANRRAGTYVRIGNLVWVAWVVFANPLTHSTASGNLHISGLPFAAASDVPYWLGPCTIQVMNSGGGNQTWVQCLARPGQTVLGFSMAGFDPSFLNELIASNIPSGSFFAAMGQCMYKAA